MSYAQLTQHDRYIIYHLRLYGLGFREIGRRLGRHHTTIMREVRRNTSIVHRGTYIFEYGQRLTEERRRLPRHRRRRDHEGLWAYVLDGLKQRWSPRQISRRLQQDFPDEPSMRLTPETVYRWVYNDAASGGTLYMSLRRHHTKRRRQRRLAQARHRFRGRVSIHERPDIVDSRTRFGDWEGDSVLGAMGKGSIITLLERKSRYLLAARLKDRTASTLSRQANRLMKPLPAHWKQTLTLDNGSEFARFKAIKRATKLDIYFADPHAPWQRGANENVNGLLRQYFPKGCDFTKVTQNMLDKAVNEINNRPRQCLGFRTPNEVRLANGGALANGI